MKNKLLQLGNITTKDFIKDPKRLAITLSRYKFVGKMFDGFEKVLEVGAGDGFKSISIKNNFRNFTITDMILWFLILSQRKYGKVLKNPSLVLMV